MHSELRPFGGRFSAFYTPPFPLFTPPRVPSEIPLSAGGFPPTDAQPSLVPIQFRQHKAVLAAVGALRLEVLP
jgi:hypothetical protein